MIPQIEPMLFTDSQQAPSRRCGRCGKEIYPPGWYCPQCGRAPT